MASSSAEPIDVPPLPPKLRPKPQRKGNIGAGKRYADEQEFQDDVERWEYEHDERKKLVQEREQAQERQREQQRDRSGRQRNASDSDRRVRQRREQEAQRVQQEADLEARCAEARARGIASGDLIPLEREGLQFLNDAERAHYDLHCPFGCPKTARHAVYMTMQFRGHKFDDPPNRHIHVCVNLHANSAVRVQGRVIGYGSGGPRVRRIDTCACQDCDDVRRGIRVVTGDRRGGWSEFGDNLPEHALRGCCRYDPKA